MEYAVATELTGIFNYNDKHPETNTPYIKFPKKFIFDKKEWRIRKQGTKTLGRVYSTHPSTGELLYLRMLLCDTTFNHSARKKSFVDLRTVDGVEYDTYKETCRALGLLEVDQLWRSVMEDASFQQLPKQMRALFIMIMMETELSDPKDLLESFHESMSEDFQHKLLPSANTDQVLLRTMLLIDLLERLQRAGKEEKFKELGAVVTDEMRQRVEQALREHARFHQCREVCEEINHDNEEMEQQLRIALHGEGTNHRGKVTVSQLAVYQSVKAAVEGNSPNKHIFIDTRGGTGKTFLMNRLLYYVRTLDHDSIALAVAFTRIAAQLLQGGRTYNARFKFPINADSKTTCSICKGTGLARLIQKAKLIVWDEAPVSNKILLEALDRLLQNLMDNKQPFGGKVIVLA